MHFLDLLKNYAIINYNRSKHIIRVFLVIAGAFVSNKANLCWYFTLPLRKYKPRGVNHVHDRT